MTLLNDVARCQGMTYTFSGMPVFCPLAQKCARYVERHTGGERTPKYAYLCLNDESSYIPTEKTNDD